MSKVMCRVDTCQNPRYNTKAIFCLQHKQEKRKAVVAKSVKKNQAKSTKKLFSWRKNTVNGFLCFVYSNMRNRVKGVTGHPMPEIWKDKPLLPKNDFYAWAKSDASFLSLFDAWVDLGHPSDSTPSINRIDSKKGYELGNMEWVKFVDNCRSNVKFRKSQT